MARKAGGGERRELESIEFRSARFPRPAPAAILTQVTEPPNIERTAWSPGLLGFYAAVGMASLGGAVSGVGYFVMRGQDGMRSVLLWIGILMMVAGLLGGIRFLKAARNEV